MKAKDNPLRDKLIRYAVSKVNYENAEQDILKELKKQLKKNGIKLTPTAQSITNLRMVDGGVMFDYRVVNYDESEPASILLK